MSVCDAKLLRVHHVSGHVYTKPGISKSRCVFKHNIHTNPLKNQYGVRRDYEHDKLVGDRVTNEKNKTMQVDQNIKSKLLPVPSEGHDWPKMVQKEDAPLRVTFLYLCHVDFSMTPPLLGDQQLQVFS